MGYRAWNNYEQAAAEQQRAAWAVLPWRRRLALRARQLVIMALVLGLPALLIARTAGLF